MPDVEISPGTWIAQDTYDRLVVAATDIKLEECIDITNMSDDEFFEHVCSRPFDASTNIPESQPESYLILDISGRVSDR